MQNTSCCQPCDLESRTRVIDILGKKIRVKDYICSSDGVNYPKKPDNIQLQLSVCPTSFCPAQCPFCIATDTKAHRTLDLKIFERVMRLLKDEDRIRGIKITGGEPFYDFELLSEVITMLFDIFGLELELSISTNGMWLDKLHKIKYFEHIESIHISRHHYDDDINRSLFGGADVPTGDKLKEIIDTVSFKDIFVLNCMLLKNYINSPLQAHRFLDFAIKIGAAKVGFMSCMPINEYAKVQAIPYESVIKESDEAMLFTRGFYDYEFCRCSDGVYASQSGEIIEFYGRSTKPDGCKYSRGLVFDADNHLRDGFGGEIIV